jgi:hypothetical protein
MSKINPVTAVNIGRHPNGSILFVDVYRGLNDDKATFNKMHTYYMFAWRNTPLQAERTLKRARLMQDILFSEIEFKESANE